MTDKRSGPKTAEEAMRRLPCGKWTVGDGRKMFEFGRRAGLEEAADYTESEKAQDDTDNGNGSLCGLGDDIRALKEKNDG